MDIFYIFLLKWKDLHNDFQKIILYTIFFNWLFMKRVHLLVGHYQSRRLHATKFIKYKITALQKCTSKNHKSISIFTKIMCFGKAEAEEKKFPLLCSIKKSDDSAIHSHPFLFRCSDYRMTALA